MTTNAIAERSAAPKASILAKMAERFSVEPNKLLDTLKATAFKSDKGCTNEQMISLLIVADQYSLNPFTNDVPRSIDDHVLRTLDIHLQELDMVDTAAFQERGQRYRVNLGVTTIVDGYLISGPGSIEPRDTVAIGDSGLQQLEMTDVVATAVDSRSSKLARCGSNANPL